MPACASENCHSRDLQSHGYSHDGAGPDPDAGGRAEPPDYNHVVCRECGMQQTAINFRNDDTRMVEGWDVPEADGGPETPLQDARTAEQTTTGDTETPTTDSRETENAPQPEGGS